jgi:hypothetical protein
MLPGHDRTLQICWVALLCAVSATFGGCAEEQLEFSEVKRVDEKVTEPELLALLEIISRLPNKRLPKLPPLYMPPPQWNEDRTLPVNELVEEEQRLMLDRQSVESMAANLHRNAPLQRALRRVHITPEQFVGLITTMGVALSRTTLRDDQDLEKVLKRGEVALAELKQNNQRFSALRPDERHRVLQQAIWITRLDRAQWLKMVPPENVALARTHRDILTQVLPAEFAENPLEAVVDLLEERGMPFEELAESGTDGALEWSREDAIEGFDEPDAAALSSQLSAVSGP